MPTWSQFAFCALEQHGLISLTSVQAASAADMERLSAGQLADTHDAAAPCQLAGLQALKDCGLVRPCGCTGQANTCCCVL